ncbi:hypothetical protein J6590_036077 [Homalodisca vitripennis]|nr:hypothetical protein J6590_036077 [Homalodisca vitripennis]
MQGPLCSSRQVQVVHSHTTLDSKSTGMLLLKLSWLVLEDCSLCTTSLPLNRGVIHQCPHLCFSRGVYGLSKPVYSFDKP